MTKIVTYKQVPHCCFFVLTLVPSNQERKCITHRSSCLLWLLQPNIGSNRPSFSSKKLLIQRCLLWGSNIYQEDPARKKVLFRRILCQSVNSDDEKLNQLTTFSSDLIQKNESL
jgi:hypothetical protein